MPAYIPLAAQAENCPFYTFHSPNTRRPVYSRSIRCGLFVGYCGLVRPVLVAIQPTTVAFFTCTTRQGFQQQRVLQERETRDRKRSKGDTADTTDTPDSPTANHWASITNHPPCSPVLMLSCCVHAMRSIRACFYIQLTARNSLYCIV